MAQAPAPIFFTLVNTQGQKRSARLLIDSIREFAGPLSESAIWIFEGDTAEAPCADLKGKNVEVFGLQVDPSLADFIFSKKVCACASAEEKAAGSGRTIVWMASDALVLKPPALLDLGSSHDAAVRPVHIKNVGAPARTALDGFWKGVYGAAGLEDSSMDVITYVDRQTIRAYFNSHWYAVNPSIGIFREWLRVFGALVQDGGFMSAHCADDPHKIFLHQAVLSAVTLKMVPIDRLRILPPSYSYPYNLHASVSAEDRPRFLDDLVTVVYEDRLAELASPEDIEVREPLRSWLSARAGAAR
jgi:hypothetical protein